MNFPAFPLGGICIPSPGGFDFRPRKKATIAQSDLVGFTTLASSREPMEAEGLIHFVGEVVGWMDWTVAVVAGIWLDFFGKSIWSQDGSVFVTQIC